MIRLTELAEQSLLLRMDFVRTSIEFSLTVASFPEAQSQSDRFRERCRRVARKAYGEIRSLIAKPVFAELDVSEILPKLQELERMIEQLEGTEPSKVIPIRQESPGGNTAPRAGLEALTPREIEVLRLIAEGHSTKEVAHTLGMSFKTAACHRYRVMDKLGIHDAVTLTHYAVRNGLVKV
jgi:DNA-binding CsgD family transcriptional regulator